MKVLRAESLNDRFDREALILAELSHPGIVRYVAHGSTPSGDAGCKWRDRGRGSSRRLRGGGAGPGRDAGAGFRAAEALGEAHRRVVHRDVKPAQPFLAGCEERCKLDLGGARTVEPRGADQHRADDRHPRLHGARADPRRAAARRARRRLLAGLRALPLPHRAGALRRRRGRPRHAQGRWSPPWRAPAQARSSPPSTIWSTACSPSSPTRGLWTAPRWRPRSLRLGQLGGAALVAASALGRLGDGAAARGAGGARPGRGPGVDEPGSRSPPRALRRDAPRALLSTDRWWSPWPGTDSATDQAVRGAVRAGLPPCLPGVPLALFAGRAALTSATPTGVALDRGAALLACTRAATGVLPRRRDARAPRRALRGAGGESRALVAERDPDDTTRVLLGKPTACVGRDAEIGRLLSYLDEARLRAHGPRGAGRRAPRARGKEQARPRAAPTRASRSGGGGDLDGARRSDERGVAVRHAGLRAPPRRGRARGRSPGDPANAARGPGGPAPRGRGAGVGGAVRGGDRRRPLRRHASGAQGGARGSAPPRRSDAPGVARAPPRRDPGRAALPGARGPALG